MKKRSTLKFLAMLLLLAQLFSLTAGITVFAAENETERDEVVETVPPPKAYGILNGSRSENPISMGGYNYTDAIIFSMGYNSGGGDAEVNYNFEGKYTSLTFEAGYLKGSAQNVSLSVSTDGETVIEDTLKASDIPKSFTVDLTGVHRLSIHLYNGAYDTTHYAIVNLQATPVEGADLTRTYKESDPFFHVPCYQLGGTGLLSEDFDMGGFTYDGGYSFHTGYIAGHTKNVSFNFKKQYESMEFDVCRYLGRYGCTADAYITIDVDGEYHPDYNRAVLRWNDLPLHVKLDLKGVSQVTINIDSGAYDTVENCIGNIQLKSNGKAQGILLDATAVNGTDDYTATLTDKEPTIDLNPRVYPSDAPRDYEMKIAEGGEFITVEDNVVTAIHGGTAKIVYTLPNNKNVEVVCDITSKITEHLWDEGEITKAPTLKEKGEKLYHCTLCDKTKTEQLDKLVECEEHTWNDGEITKEPTYTEEGKALFTCTVCGKTEERVVEKLVCTDHAWDDGEVTKEPTYEAEGEKLYTCENCGETKTEPVDKLSCTDHKWDDGEVTKEPTYEAEGEKLFTCENCGETKTEPMDKLSCTDHKWDDGEVTKEPTYEAEGEKIFTCENCGKTKTETIAKLIPENPFEDIGDNDWFRDPVLWAYANGITGGIAANLFGPHESCTRGQVVTFLWAAAGKPAPTSDYNPFTDVVETDYFYKAVLWAVENGITKGIAEDLFGPAQACTRGQIVTFLWAAHNRPVPTLSENPFIDFDSSAYYYQPVLWAVENEITTGIGDGMFGPENICTRCQIVTFLYKASMIEPEEPEVPESPETPEEPVEPEEPQTALVTDAYAKEIEGKYYTHCYHIPQINLPDDLAAGWNEAMYDTLYATIEKRVLKAMETKGQPELNRMVYAWGTHGDLVSIVVREDELEYDWSTHSFYTVSAKTGMQVVDSDIYAAYGMTEEEFYAAVKIVLAAVMAEEAEHYKDMLSAEKIQELIDNTLSDENLKASKPFVSPDGKLSFMGGVYTPAGAGRYYHMWTLEGENITVKCDVH